MSNEIEKFNDRNLINAKIDAALARVRQNGTPSGVAGSSPAGTLADSEIIEIERICAVHDKPYLAVYARRANGLFRFSKSIRSTGHPSGESVGAAKRVTLEISQMEPSQCESCAWCGATAPFIFGRQINAVQCGVCRAYVCLGQTTGSYFRCRTSCGAAGELGKRWVASEGTARRDAKPQPSGADGGGVPSNRLLLAAPEPERRG